MFLYIKHPGMVLLALERFLSRVVDGMEIRPPAWWASFSIRPVPWWLRHLFRIYMTAAVLFAFVGGWYACRVIVVDPLVLHLGWPLRPYETIWHGVAMLLVVLAYVAAVLLCDHYLPRMRRAWRERHLSWYVSASRNRRGDGFATVQSISQSRRTPPIRENEVCLRIPVHPFFGPQTIGDTGWRLVQVHNLDPHNSFPPSFTLQDPTGARLDWKHRDILSYLFPPVSFPPPRTVSELLSLHWNRAWARGEFALDHLILLHRYFSGSKTNQRDRTIVDWLGEAISRTMTFRVSEGDRLELADLPPLKGAGRRRGAHRGGAPAESKEGAG